MFRKPPLLVVSLCIAVLSVQVLAQTPNGGVAQSQQNPVQVQGAVGALRSDVLKKNENTASTAVSTRPMPFDEASALDQRDISVLVVAGDETTLSSQMAGKIKKIYFGLGDAVPAGALLVEFDCAEQDAQLQTAEAEYRGARETHLTKLRLQALGAAGELEVTVAASAADRAKGQVIFRESQIAYCKLTAPFAGRIAKTRVKVAESVPAGQSMLDIVNPGSLKAQLFVPATWTYWLRPGVRFQVKTSGEGKTYNARVSKMNSRVEGISQSLELEGRFEGSTQGLLPGMVGTAIFPARPAR
jgi:RND family efflux transporter MFP subunit